MYKFKNKLIYSIREKIINGKKYIYFLSFLIPFFILIFTYIIRGVYPFGDRIYLARDMYHQYAPFFSEFHSKLINGENLTYSWNIGLGTNFTALYAYYLASPLNWILFLFNRKYLIELMNILIIVKIALSSVTCTYYLRKHYNRKDTIVLVISMFYALSAYVSAYAWNIMWLDCLLLLPLIVLGIERLVKENKGYLYFITLSISIISNYYISYMICFYMILYFIVLLFTNDTKKDWTYYKERVLKFAFFSILAGASAAFIIVPEYFALKVSAAGDMAFPDNIKRYFSIYEILSRGLMNLEVSATTENDPNIYSSVLVYLLLPLYCMITRKKTKEKVSKILLVVFFLLSFNFNILNYIWHGFHFPNSLPARQSFIFIFLILTMAYESLIYIKEFKDKQIYGAFAGAVILFLSYEHFLVGDEFDYQNIYLSILFIAIYILALQLYRHIKVDYDISSLKRNIVISFIIIVAITETTINFSQTGIRTTSRETYITDNKDIDFLLNEIKENEENKESFYRVEKYKRRTKNDSAWHGYKGASVFSSASNDKLNEYLKHLGFEKSKNASSFYGHTPLTSSLLSVKYMFTKEILTEEYMNLTTLIAESEGEYLYRNNYTLPLGFMLPQDFELSWNNKFNNPFIVQNEFVKILLDNNLFDEITIINNESEATLKIENNKEVCVYVPTKGVESIEFLMTDINGNEITSYEYDNHKRPHIINLGRFEVGDFIHISSPDITSDLKVHAYAFNEEVFVDVYEKLSQQPFIIESFDDTLIKGKIKANDDGLMYTSIPYDKGWSVTVDGKEIETVAFKDALLAVPLTAGEHTIELSYRSQGLKFGIGISIISLIYFGIIVFRDKKNTKKYNNNNRRGGQ